LQKEDFLFEKLNFCVGIAVGLRKILYEFLETKTIPDKDFGCLLALAECLENSLENLSKELNSNL